MLHLEGDGHGDAGLCADEAVQIFGGYGFRSGYEVERAYRDQRVNRIFEGTNEINRLLITDMLMKRSMKGQIALDSRRAETDRRNSGNGAAGGDWLTMTPLAEETRLVEGAKKVLLLVAGSAVQRYMLGLEHEQEVIGVISNLVMAVYAMESVLLRTLKKLRARPSRSVRGGNCGGARVPLRGRPIAWRWRRGARWRASPKATRCAPNSPCFGVSCGARRPIPSA